MKSCDVAIVGGGVMGCAVAFHLLRADPTLRVTAIERDPTYERASSALSMGNVRVQFSLERNIEMSLYALEVLQRFADDMAVDGERPDIAFKQEGNLFLVETEAVEAARGALERQRALGCRVEWWTPEEIRGRYPLYRPEGLEGGTWGADDGHLDGYALLMGYRRKAASLGVRFLDTEVARIRRSRRGHSHGRVDGVDFVEGGRLDCAVVLSAAGAWSARLVRDLGVELPVVPVQRQVFVVEPAIKPESPLPLTNLPSGLYFRSEGPDRLLVGKSLLEDRVGFDLRWQESRFTEELWPELVGFVPEFDRLRLERGWAGLYAVNTFDGNALLGEWPELEGLYFACGFSGHGLQQAPAVGRYLAELILRLEPELDLSIFSVARLLEGRRLTERAQV